MNFKQIFVFLVIIISIQLLAHFVVYEGVNLVFGPYSGVWIPVSQFLLVFLTFAFVALILFVSKFNNFLTRFLYRTFAVWQGFLLYFFLASTVSILAMSLGFEVSKEYGVGVFVLAFLTGVYGVINAKNIKVKKISVSLKNLPEIWNSKNVVWISDVHLGQVNAEGFLKKIVSKINTLNPDLVLIGGDLYDGVKVNTNEIVEPLRNLKTTSGTYFITGNHDGFTDASTIEDIKAIESIGIKVLQDTMVEIDGVQMIGIDYKHSNARENFRQRLSELNINKEMPSLLLKHIPSDVDIAREAGIDLQLSGHTHRAQMWPLSYLPKIIYKGFDYGLKKTGDTQIYTSSGVGTWGPPLRVGSNSEIVLINFI